ncbi:MAG: serine/threonine-protein kinase [Kofleriaceae bacterium]
MQAGDMLGRYQLVTPIGRGGMGEVWLATSSGSGGFSKQVVVKTILPERANDPAFIDMLTREARVCAELSHPNLIEVFDFSEHDGVYMIAMEYVVGRSLSQIVRAARAAERSIPAWCALRMVWESCRGLEAAHARNIIHCDLSPGNIMLSFTGFTKVLDFGVAHSASSGVRADRLKGKYHYMAPERIKSLATDARTDVYALGVILYVLFTGRLPFTAPSDEALLYAIVSQKARPPRQLRAMDPDIEAVIIKAMQRDPGLRYQSVGAMAQAISKCREGHPGACSQQDMAIYLGSLFPDAPDLPEHVRATLDAIPISADATDTQRRLSLLAYGSAELDELDSASLDIQLDEPSRAPAERGGWPSAPTARERAVGPEYAGDGPSTSMSLTSPSAVHRLFQGSSVSRVTTPGLFDSSPELAGGSARGVFATEGTGARSEAVLLEERSSLEDVVPPPPNADLFGDVGSKESPREPTSWPWAASLLKRT